MTILDFFLKENFDFYFIPSFLLVFLTVVLVFKDPLKGLLDIFLIRIKNRNEFCIKEELEKIRDLLINIHPEINSSKLDDIKRNIDNVLAASVQSITEVQKELSNISINIKEFRSEMSSIISETYQSQKDLSNIGVRDQIFQNNLEKIIQKMDLFHDTLVKINTRMEIISGKSINF